MALRMSQRDELLPSGQLPPSAQTMLPLRQPFLFRGLPPHILSTQDNKIPGHSV